VTAAADLPGAYATCLALAGAHYENFPVASWLLPRNLRPHVAAIYAFARTADDFADEGGLTDRERLRLLDEWLDHLHRALGAGEPIDPAEDPSRSAIFTALADTVRRFDLPVVQLEALLSAFRQDVTVHRYASWGDVDDYCRRSANPVGRLVLRLFGHRDERLDGWSDAICSALQLANFWQDFAIDWSRGRLYVPESEWRAAGARLADLDAGPTVIPRECQRALAACCSRTRGLFERGAPLLDHVHGRLRWELRATWHGGWRVLERLEQGGFDPIAARPRLGAADALVIGWRTLL
jgi:squalene synthase HpnC